MNDYRNARSALRRRPMPREARGGPVTIEIDGQRVTVGFSALDDGRWLPAISVDPDTVGESRRMLVAGRAHAQTSPKAAILLACDMARDWRRIVTQDPIACSHWFAID